MNAAARFSAREVGYGRTAPAPAKVSAAAARRRRTLELLALAGPPGGELRVYADAGGRFHVDALADGAAVRMLFDTGATRSILAAGDARLAGIRVGAFTESVRTASGVTRAAAVTIDELRIGARFTNVSAFILAGGDECSVLGADVLARFTSVEIRGDMMRLKW